MEMQIENDIEKLFLQQSPFLPIVESNEKYTGS